MKVGRIIFLILLPFLGKLSSATAQEANIVVPVDRIATRSEFSTDLNVLYTNRTYWNGFFIWMTSPTFNSISGANFRQANTNVVLPTDVLQYRLESIGGERPKFFSQDEWPDFTSFSTSPQPWYDPHWRSNHRKGNIVFTFKIPRAQFASNKFQGGKYTMLVANNYEGDFTPNPVTIAITIPSAIEWLSGNTVATATISSLDQYRYIPSFISSSLGNFDLLNTVGFNLYGKSSSPNIQFTSSKGVNGNRSISVILLGGTHPNITSGPLTAGWKKFSANSFSVEIGNRQNFDLTASVSETDFKNNFFEAGTYTFQVNLEARSQDNIVKNQKNIDFTVQVQPLSEITLPTGGNQVNFEFNTISHYQNGQTKIIPSQLRISNNETYELYVKSDEPFFRKSGIQSDLPASILQVKVEGMPQAVSLSPTSQKIIDNGTPVLDKNLNLQYTIPPNAAQSLVAKEKSTYSINVIYSFTAL